MHLISSVFGVAKVGNSSATPSVAIISVCFGILSRGLSSHRTYGGGGEGGRGQWGGAGGRGPSSPRDEGGRGATVTIEIEEVDGLGGLVLEDDRIGDDGAVPDRRRLRAVHKSWLGALTCVDLHCANLVFHEEAAVGLAARHGARAPDVTVHRGRRTPHPRKQQAVRHLDAVAAYSRHFRRVGGHVAEVDILAVAAEAGLGDPAARSRALGLCGPRARLGRALRRQRGEEEEEGHHWLGGRLVNSAVTFTED